MWRRELVTNRFLMLLLVNGLSNFGHYSTYPLLALYLLHSMHISYSTTSLLLLFFVLSLRITRIFLTPLVDILGLKTCLITTMAICFLGYLLLAFSRSLELILIAMLLIGAGYGTNSLAIKVHTSVLPERTMMIRYSLLNIITNTAGITAPFIGNTIFANYPHHAICLFSAAIFLIGGIITAYLPIENLLITSEKNWLKNIFAQFKPTKSLFALTITFISWFHLAQFSAFLPLYLSERLSEQNLIGMIYIINGLMIILFSVKITKYINHHTIPLSTQITLFLAFFFAGFILLYLFKNIAILFIAIVFWSIGEIIIVPITSALTIKSTSVTSRSVGFSANAIAIGLGEGIGSFIGVSLAGYAKTTSEWTLSLSIFNTVGFIFLLMSMTSLVHSRLKALDSPPKETP